MEKIGYPEFVVLMAHVKQQCQSGQYLTSSKLSWLRAVVPKELRKVAVGKKFMFISRPKRETGHSQFKVVLKPVREEGGEILFTVKQMEQGFWTSKLKQLGAQFIEIIETFAKVGI